MKAYCHKRDGKFRLAYLKSEDVVIELERKPQERSHGGGRAAAAWPPPPLSRFLGGRASRRLTSL